jgi:N-acetylated-alpha-linked acidic dipeptidase
MKSVLVLAFAGVAWAQSGSVSAQEIEKKLRSFPDPTRAREYMKRMAAEPHHAGSPGSKAVADYALGLLREWGFEATIEEFEALLPYPAETRLELTAPVKVRLKLKEPVLPADPDSGDRGQLPLYNAYSGSGDVTAPLVYVNYGVPADYQRLAKLGVDVKGKIVIARYGGSWRGTKPKVAAEHGAVGCLIYSDPKDDGYYQGDTFPRGPFRPSNSAQRGSVMDMPVYVGDPLSPGWASVKGGRKLKREEAVTIMKIPVLPISWSDALPLLENLGGPIAPPEWRGALSITYHIGAGPAEVHLKTESDWTSKPVYNVIARMPGAVLPDEWVIYGNHHDAWVNGAADPISGAIALLETARAFSQLKATGWQPRRTLLFALWDAEEFGLIGSTEWVEQHRDELQRKAMVYLNTDMNVGGRLGAGGSQMLEQFFTGVIRDIEDPAKGKSLLALAAEAPGEDGVTTAGQPFALGPLGAGSDYVAFVHHAGIPSLNLGFSRPGGSGTYHSIYDSYAWFATQMDKDFQYSRLLAQVMATSILRLSEAPLIPHDFRAVARVVRQWTGEIKTQYAKLDLSELSKAAEGLEAAAKRYQEAAARKPSDPARFAAANRILLGAERALTRQAGLPGRPWFRNQLYAPGLYTGYSARTLPGVREAADLGKMDEAQQQSAVLAETVREFAALVDRAAGALMER